MLLERTYHKYFKFGIAFLLFTCLSHGLFSQEKAFAQFLFHGIESPEQVQQIDSLMMSKSGVLFTRFNYVNQNMLLMFDSSQNYDGEDFELFLSELELEFFCFRQGILGVDTMKVLTVANCSEEKPEEH